MIRPEEFLGLVPARGGSRGIPRKNVKEFAGRPLLAWSVEVARASGVLGRVVCSTEDEAIAGIARQCGAEVPFLRPRELAGDQTPTAAVVRHALDRLRASEGYAPRFVMILEPTSPSRRPRHVAGAAELLAGSGAESLASISPVPHHFVAQKQLRLGRDGQVTGLDGGHVRDMVHRRQDLPTSHAFNGLIFACRVETLAGDPPSLWGTRVIGYEIESRYALDIDEPEDWAPAEARFRELLEKEGTS